MSRKSVKSIQNVLNEAETYLSNMLEEDLISISKSAYSQAREKIKYEAFIELCNDIKEQFYKEYDYEKYKGFTENYGKTKDHSPIPAKSVISFHSSSEMPLSSLK
jgi:hypothetical protein